MKTELRLTEPNAARDAGFIEQVKATLDLPADARLELQGATQNAQGSTIEYAASALKIVGAEFGVANGVSVDERANISLRFDARGALMASQVSPADARHLRLVQDQIKKLAAADEIFLAPPNQDVDPDTLRAQRKPWYVATDAQGRKRLKRAYMA